MQSTGNSGSPVLMDTFVRLTKSPVVSIAKIRGRARGVSSEFVLACDMRFASRREGRVGAGRSGFRSASGRWRHRTSSRSRGSRSCARDHYWLKRFPTAKRPSAMATSIGRSPDAELYRCVCRQVRTPNRHLRSAPDRKRRRTSSTKVSLPPADRLFGQPEIFPDRRHVA